MGETINRGAKDENQQVVPRSLNKRCLPGKGILYATLFLSGNIRRGLVGFPKMEAGFCRRPGIPGI
jgi:hypothetical protein